MKFEGTLASVCNFLGLTKLYSERIQKITHNITVTGIECDTRRVKEGTIFYAKRGAHFNPFEHLAEVKAKGAVAVLIDGPDGVDQNMRPFWLNPYHSTNLASSEANGASGNQDAAGSSADLNHSLMPAWTSADVSDPRAAIAQERRSGSAEFLLDEGFDLDTLRSEFAYLTMTAEGQAVKESGLLCLMLPDFHMLSQLASFIYGNPSEKLRVIGVTGTNGKSTITSLLAQLLNACGHKVALFGTVGYGFLDDLQPASNTTLDAITLQQQLAHYVELGADYAVMEVSSIGFCEGRVAGVQFYAGCFSNISRDHLDYHLNMDDYMLAKLNFLRMIPPARLALNTSTEKGKHLAEAFPDCYEVSFNKSEGNPRALNHFLSIRQVEYKTTGLDIYINLTDDMVVRADLPLMGYFNAQNSFLMQNGKLILNS